jgi:ribonuclease HII
VKHKRAASPGTDSVPTIDLELEVQSTTGVCYIAGIDEAGRGAIAGPVTAASVILPLDQPDLLERLKGVNDSKRLSARRREALYILILQVALTSGSASTSAKEIDNLGIIPANAQAMSNAVSSLDPQPEHLLIDGRMRLKNLPHPQDSIIRGDGKSLSIAAASILAKVRRDRFMVKMDERYPGYGFARHKGYCTPQHVAALSEMGPCPIHRYSFAPIRQPLL